VNVTVPLPPESTWPLWGEWITSSTTLLGFAVAGLVAFVWWDRVGRNGQGRSDEE